MANNAAATPVGTANGTRQGTPDSGAEDESLLALNKRLPRGRPLPGYGIEYFNQLVAQYLMFPDLDRTVRQNKAAAVATEIIKEQNRQRLNWGDVSGLELALLQLMPKPELERFAWNLRARYHEVAGQGWYDFYQHSGPPDDIGPTKEAPSPTVVVANTPVGTLSSHVLMMPAPQASHPTDETKGAAPGDASATATLRADLSVLLSDLQRLRSTIQAREEKRSDISRWGAVAAALSLFVALAVYAVSGHFGGQIVRPIAPAPPGVSAPLTRPTGSVQTAPGPKSAPVTSPSGPPAVSTVPDILQTAALVILCGVLGGLISMLRRLQDMPSGSTPLIDTVALNAGQFGIGLAPVYGGIFAMVLYLVFLSRLLDSIIAPTAQAAAFPMFNDATPAATADAAKLLVWAFVAGFAEKLVPDVLNRLTAKNTAPAQAQLPSAPGIRRPSHPA